MCGFAAACPPIWSCSKWGLPCRRVLPPARCALTAPFHPYRDPTPKRPALRRFAFCCTFRGLTPPRRYLALCPWSPDFPPRLRAAVAWPTPARMVEACGREGKRFAAAASWTRNSGNTGDFSFLPFPIPDSRFPIPDSLFQFPIPILGSFPLRPHSQRLVVQRRTFLTRQARCHLCRLRRRQLIQQGPQQRIGTNVNRRIG